MHLMETAARWALETSLAASVLMIPALIAAFFLRKHFFTPIRHMLGLLIVARLLLPFALPSPVSIFNILQPESFWATASQRGFHFQDSALAPTETVVESTPLPIPAPNISLSLRSAPAPKSIPLIPLLWSLGVLAIFTRVIFQHIKIRLRLRALNHIASGPAIDALNSALELSGSHRNIKLYSMPNLSTPALFGLFRPSILLPSDLAQSNDLTRLRLVCLHEIAHLKRIDVLINWLAIFAQTLHWFNPLVWFTLRRLRVDQELLCDSDVMRILHPDDHRAYGETLLALASPRHYALSTLIPVSSSFKQLKERIAMIKQFKPATHRLLVFTLPALAAIVAILTFTAAANKRPAPTARQTPPPQTESEKSAERIGAMQIQFDVETARVRELEKQVDELRKALRIFDLDNGTHPSVLQPETVRRMDEDRLRAGHEYAQFEKLYSTLSGKPRSELRQIIPTAYRDEALDRLLEKLNQTEQQLVQTQKDYSDGHPDVVRLTSLMKTLNEQIESRITGILDGLQAVVGARKAIVDSITKQLDEAKVADAENVEKYRPYFQAKRDLETHQKFRDTLYLRLLEAQANRAIDR